MSSKVKFHIYHDEEGCIEYGRKGAILRRFRIFPRVPLVGVWFRGQSRCHAANGAYSSETGQSVDSNEHFKHQPMVGVNY
jgi:hypothetical protein